MARRASDGVDPRVAGRLRPAGRHPDDCGPAHSTARSSAALAANPQRSTRLAEDNAALALLQELYEGLTAEAADGSIVPGAADAGRSARTAAPGPSDCGENLRWSDGDPLTAAQFVAGLDAARVQARRRPMPRCCSRSRRAASTGFPHRRARVGPRHAAPAGRAGAAVRRAAALAASDHAGTIIGNGPYRLLARRPGEKIELERNPHYPRRRCRRDRTRDVPDARRPQHRTEPLSPGELDVTSEVPNAQIDLAAAEPAG